MASEPKFKISTEGTSKTTVLSAHTSDQGYVPIARFYAGRFNQSMLDFIEERLNA